MESIGRYKKSFLLCFLFWLPGYCTGYCQNTEGLTEAEFVLCRIAIDKSDLAAAKRIAETATGEERVRLLIVIGEHYVLLPAPVKNIKILEKEAQLQKRKLEQSMQLGMWSSAAMILLVAFLAILYNRNRLKNRKNIQLERQKEIINEKNLSLSQLVREKEWLLKEVHHRVKNNLQIVTSLLNSQSDIIGEGPVVDALLEGKHRIQAMAMIHQRLYNTDEYNCVLMPSYISELVDYLKESFNPGTRIIFKLSIDPVALNLSVAVPCALILNEAISNSLKHGFPNGREGTVTVELRSLGGQRKLLRVADDGIGIPPSVDETNPASFGLRLIRGFTSDISGTLKIEKCKGTSIVIVFDVADLTINSIVK